MLDGIPCDTIIEGILLAGQAGCENAESVGHGIAPSGIGYIQFSSIGSSGAKFWHNGTNVLKYNTWEIGNTITSVNSEIVGSVTPEGTGKTIYYTNGINSNSTFRLDLEFGVTGHTISSGEKSLHGCQYVNIHMNNSNICTIRGMRLPVFSELKHNDGEISFSPCSGTSPSLGLPEASIGLYSWSASAYTQVSSYYGVWKSTDGSNNTYSGNHHVRCVR